MTASAQSVLSLEAHVTDDVMDLRTDDGYGLGDGDIDLDIGLTADAYQPDDDVLSLQDAGTDGGVDLQVPSGDHDDFMVDKEDVIEEDDIDYGDLEIGDAGHSTFDSIANGEDEIVDHVDLPESTGLEVNIHHEETVEEDLIDYSDDEVEHAPKATPVVYQEKPIEEIAEEHNIQDLAEHGNGAGHEGEAGNDGADLYNQVENQAWTENTQANWDEDAGGQYPVASNNNTDYHPDDHHNNGHNFEAGPDITKADESSADVIDETATGDGGPDYQEEATDVVDETTKGDDQQDYQEEATGEVDETTKGDVEQNYQEEAKQHSNHPELAYPITINYDGSEFWLFKQDDSRDGEWLLDDHSLATKPIYDLFNACRTQLADDVNGDTELGFRFDHFHALTVYEDSTACAVTSLRDLLELYLELHAQDGNSDPDSFFITLQFRPRVVSLIGELRKAVQDQIGFSGWNNQVATGQTIFTSSYSHANTEDYQEQWEGDKSNNEGQDYIESFKEEDARSEEDDGSVKDDQYEDTGSNESPSGDTASSKPTPGIQDETPHRSNSEGASEEASPEDEEDEGGIVDYGEGEGQSDTAAAGEQSGNDGSQDSSTVEGDDVSHAAPEAEDSTNHAESYENTRESENDEESVESAHDEQDTTDAGNADPYGQHNNPGANANDDDEYPYDDLDRGYGQGYPLDKTAHPFGGNEYPTEGINQSGDDYYYEDGNTTFYEQDEFALTAGANDQVEPDRQDDADQAPGEDELVGVDDFLDLTGDLEENSGEDVFASFANDDVQDDDQSKLEGVPLPTQVAASPAASPVVASSTGLEGLGSPQGLKRPIDRVDAGHMDASDPTDAKRQKL